MLNDQQAHDILHAAGDQIVVGSLDPNAVIEGSRRRRTRRVLTVVALAAAVSAIAVGGLALGFDPDPAGGPAAEPTTTSTGTQNLDAAPEHRLWLIARQTAESLGGEIKIAQAVRSQHKRAERLTSGARVSDNQAVWVIQIEGDRKFVCGICPGPAGARSPRGRFVTIVLDAKTFERSDFGIGAQRFDLGRLGTVITLHE